MGAIEITELEGDGIGPELARSVRAVAEALPTELVFAPVDWSLAAREARGDAAIDEAERALRRTRVALKYPTTTKDRSPNALIRRRLGFSVIYRPSATIPGIRSLFGGELDLQVVRVATGGTYEDPGMHVGRDSAVSLRLVEREPCAQAAAFAFELARARGVHVTSSSKYTIQKATDGLFQRVVAEVAAEYPEVPHRVELFDALLGKIVMRPQDYRVVLVLNEYGDFLSDMAAGLVGSLGVAASGTYSFDAERRVDIAMFDPAHGTAPDIAGKDVCNPSAALLAFGMLLDRVGRPELAGALRDALLSALADGETTRDLGGHLSTTAFTEAVVGRLSDRLRAR